MSIAGSFDAACSSVAKLPSALARSVAFCAYMRRAKRTFCWLDTKWLCQNSVIRSVSGEGVDEHLLHPPRAKLESPAYLLLLERLALFRRRVFGARITHRA